MLAWFLLAIPVSSLVGGPTAGLLLQMDGQLHLAGWQWIFVAQGAPAILLGIATYFVLVDSPRDAKWLTSGERDALLKALASEPRHQAQHHFAAALKDLRVLILTAIQFGFTLGTYGVGIWLPLMMKEHNLTNLQIGFLSMPPYLAASLGMLVWARYADRSARHILHLTLACLLAAAGLIASVLFAQLALRLVALTVALIGISSARAVFWTIPPRFLRDRRRRWPGIHQL